jgi:hypothetical protein
VTGCSVLQPLVSSAVSAVRLARAIRKGKNEGVKAGKLGGFVFLAGVAGLLANCGGESFKSSNRESGGGGESGTSAGTGAMSGSSSGGTSSGGDGAGGSSTRGGRGGAAGTGSPTGGTSGTSTGGTGAATGGRGGTTAGTGMTGGDAGAGGEPGFCLLPADPGMCLASMPRYFFNTKTGVCQPFTYGGCGGNGNNFETIEACYGACGGQGEIDPAACQYPTDCTLIPSGCCGCGQASLTGTVAVNTAKAAEYSEAMLCHLIDCATCPQSPNPWLGATCRAGRCVAFDARQTALTECTTPEDCRFRAGLTCCEACSPSRSAFIALNADADVSSWVCGDWPGGCGACVPVVPQNLSVTCGNGRCGVLDAELPQ